MGCPSGQRGRNALADRDSPASPKVTGESFSEDTALKVTWWQDSTALASARAARALWTGRGDAKALKSVRMWNFLVLAVLCSMWDLSSGIKPVVPALEGNGPPRKSRVW